MIPNALVSRQSHPMTPFDGRSPDQIPYLNDADLRNLLWLSRSIELFFVGVSRGHTLHVFPVAQVTPTEVTTSRPDPEFEQLVLPMAWHPTPVWCPDTLAPPLAPPLALALPGALGGPVMMAPAAPWPMPPMMPVPMGPMAGEAMMELEAPNLQMLPMPMPAPGREGSQCACNPVASLEIVTSDKRKYSGNLSMGSLMLFFPSVPQSLVAPLRATYGVSSKHSESACICFPSHVLKRDVIKLGRPPKEPLEEGN